MARFAQLAREVGDAEFARAVRDEIEARCDPRRPRRSCRRCRPRRSGRASTATGESAPRRRRRDSRPERRRGAARRASFCAARERRRALDRSRCCAEPEVAQWWGGWDLERVERELIADEEEEWLAIELDGEPVGIVGWWEEGDPQYRYAGIDISLRTGCTAGAWARTPCARSPAGCSTSAGITGVTIDPAADNDRAIRCYERVGFRRVGVMRRYERLASGESRDGLLMDLLPEELTSPRRPRAWTAQADPR